MILYIVGKSGPTSVPIEIASRISDKESRIEVVSFRDRKDSVSKDFGINIKSIGSRSVWDLAGVYRLLCMIKRKKPDIIHVHRTASGFWAPIIGKIFSNATIIKTEHNDHRYYRITQNIAHFISQYLSDHAIFNSRDTYENLYQIQKWAIGDEWSVIYNGVDIDRIEKASNKNTPLYEDKYEDRVLIGSVGRLVDQKNYQKLIKSFKFILEKVADAHLVLVGDGENRPLLEHEATVQGVESRVTFVGEVSRDEVYAAIHSFDLFVMPSLWEGFCVALVEAMATGKPVVCSDISTLREVAGNVATYFDPQNAESIAKTVLSVLAEEPEVKRKRGQACRKRAKDKFSLGKTAKSYIKIYKNIANKVKWKIY